MQSLNVEKKLLSGIFSPACRLRPAATCAAVTTEYIYEDETGEEFLAETELMEPDKYPGNDAYTRIQNYGRPATVALNVLLNTSAAFPAFFRRNHSIAR